MAAGFAESGVPFGHIVRQIAHGHDFAAAAAAAAEAGEGESTETVAPTTDETTGETTEAVAPTTDETAETSAPPTEETPVADGDPVIDLGGGEATDPDPDLALLEQLIEDLANDDDTIV